MNFSKEEILSRDEMSKLQLKRLQDIVSYTYKNVEYYRSKFDKINLKPRDIKVLSDIEKIPYTEKDELRLTYPYGLLAVDLKDVVRIHASSGTSGKPTVVAYTKEDLEMWTECVSRLVYAAGGSKDDIVQICFGYGLFTGALGLHQGFENIGATVIPSSSGNTKRQVMLMKDLNTTAIVSTPSYALHISEVMKEMGYKKEDFNLRIGLFGSEASSEAMHKELEEKLGLIPTDNYGLSEIIGPGVAGECLHKCGMHVNEDHFYPEIIDQKTLKPLKNGGQGELVLTTLTKKALPILRYRTKDITTLDYGNCKCGRNNVRMGKIKGRSDEMLKIKGVNIFPTQIEEVLMSINEVGQNYEIIVTRENYMDKLEIRVEVSEPSLLDDYTCLLKLQSKINNNLKTILQIDAKVTLVEPMTIQRGLAKAKRVIDKRII